MPRQLRITTQVVLENTLKFFSAKSMILNMIAVTRRYISPLVFSGVIEGAKISEYLLERSRIVFQAPDERNYHIFYEMLAGLPKAELENYGLGSVEDYFYLNKVRMVDI